MRGAMPPLPSVHSWRGAPLKHRDNSTFTFNRQWYQHYMELEEYN